MMVIAVAGGMIFTFSGIWLSYLFDIPSGATIILVSVAAYLVVLGERRLGLIGRNVKVT